MEKPNDPIRKVERGLRLDFAIALCALLISTVAAGASWYQAQLLRAQTEVLQDQLGAQVWPYVSVSEGIRNATIDVRVTNDGLGPAILRSFSATVDGRSQSGVIEILHALLGPNLIARKPRGEKIGFTIDSGSPGSVIRPGQDTIGFSFTSPHFAQRFIQNSARLKFFLCYCAIVAGKCWQKNDASEPKPVAACPAVANDLLHGSAIDEVTARTF